MDILAILGRQNNLFQEDLRRYEVELRSKAAGSKFLVIGGGGSIGQAVSKFIFTLGAKVLHVVDLNENYLVELVRDIRSNYGNLVEDFNTYALDCGDPGFESFMMIGEYDYVLNLSAMKHVRSEHDAFSIKRMFKTNVINTLQTYEWAEKFGAKKYFCVSTDKAANPANVMGATKRAMELSLMREDRAIPITGARFANVAFSNGSLLEGFRFRIEKKQPLSLPIDISRYFVTPEESGIICLFSCLMGERNDIFFPSNLDEIKLTNFYDVAERFLYSVGRKPIKFWNEEEAKSAMLSVDTDRYWPVNVFKSDTSGEKPYEEFFTETERVFKGNYKDLANIKFLSPKTKLDVDKFLSSFNSIELGQQDTRANMIAELKKFVPSFEHAMSDKFLNERM